MYVHLSPLFWIIVVLVGLLLRYYGKILKEEDDAAADLEFARRNRFRAPY
jgi:hypothetical protein